MSQEKYVSGNFVETVADIGRLVRLERKRRNLTQADFAMLVGVGRRFVIDLERGKETVEAGKMMTVLVQCGLTVSIRRE